MKELQISVFEQADLDTLLPVSGGIALPRGTAGGGDSFELRDEDGNQVPVQNRIMARWDDGSVRWLFLDFKSCPSAKRQKCYRLIIGGEHSGEGPKETVTVGGGYTLQSESISIRSSDAKDSLLMINEEYNVRFKVIDGQGNYFFGTVNNTEIVVEGPLRSTLAFRGYFSNDLGERLFQFRLRATVFAGLPFLRLEPMVLIDAGEGVMQEIGALELCVSGDGPFEEAVLGGDPGWRGTAAEEIRLFQIDDQNYRIEGTDITGGRAPGWMELNRGEESLAVALRDFWQQWPKSLETSSEESVIGLLPRFEAGQFDHMEPWYKYQYLFSEDRYLLRTGQARSWDVWLSSTGKGEQLSRMADRPLIPTLEPEIATTTGIWGQIPPVASAEEEKRNGSPVADYDGWAENLFHAYCSSIEEKRDYGAMNWGDWFGERRVNWGNHEYDTTLQLLIQYIRTGDPRYFHVADAAARHSSEVDVIHHVNEDLKDHIGRRDNWPARPGLVHQHTVGHVSGFYSREKIEELFLEEGIGGHGGRSPYLCLDPYNLGHVFTLGMSRQYFLTGNPFLKETVEKIGDNVAQLVEDREYQFMGTTHCGRVTGWSLLALAGAYELDHNERYLEAMRVLVEDALADQDPVCGGWLIYPMAPDHCICETEKHTGMATFITAILINGLCSYYYLTGDERLPEAIDEAVTFITHDTWRERQRGWRYTSCPAHRKASQSGVIMQAYVNAVRITDNPEHLRILKLAWEAMFERLKGTDLKARDAGKVYSSTMYGTAEVVGVLDELEEGD